MEPRICLISEALCPPFDEGMAVFALQLARYLAGRGEALAITNKGGVSDETIQEVRFGKTFLSGPLKKVVGSFSPDVVLYLPQASSTTASFMRTWVLGQSFPDALVAMIALQPRRHSALCRGLISRVAPKALFVQGERTRAYYGRMGIAAHVVPSGVDTEKFACVDRAARAALRARYGVPGEAFLVTHVGHLRASRNLALLECIGRQPGVHALMVASSFSQPDTRIGGRLEQAGVDVRTDYFERIEDIYQMSDAYLFPVLEERGAVEMPLSVLEALACGVPVLTTPFGAVKEAFGGCGALRFVETEADVVEAVAALRESPAAPDAAREAAMRYSWERVFDELVGTLMQSSG